MAGSVFIPLVSVFDPKGINQAKTAMASLAASMKNLKSAAAGAAIALSSVGVTNFVKESVTAARDLERNTVGLSRVFDGLTPNMMKYVEGADAIGLSQVEASKAVTFLGTVLKSSGFEMGFVGEETKKLTGLAADLSATYGYDLSEALSGMTALFRGEYDPIEKFGVAMKQSEVNALVAARGMGKLTGATLRQAQAQARLDLLYARSADAQGAYAAQAGSLYVVQTQLRAAFEDTKAALGASLTGPLASFLGNFTPLMDKLQVTLTPLFENMGKVLEGLGPVIAAKIDNFLALVDAINPLITVLTDLIVPLLIPLANIFGVLTQIITPFIPLITFLAQVIKAVLLPIVTMLNLVFMIGIKTIGKLVEGFTLLGQSIPGLGGFFKDASKNLEDWIGTFDELNGLMSTNSNTYNELLEQYSKSNLGTNPVDVVAKSVDKSRVAIQKASEQLNAFVENAVNIQKSIMSSASITSVLDSNSNEIVQSIVYLNGKFKVVAFGASKSATDIAGAFKANLMKIKTFYKNLQSLSAAGLDDSLIADITSAGPDAGNATAEAILASGKTGITSLNKTATSIKKIAGDIGVLGAKAMKNAGTKVGNGLLDGFLAEQDKLVAAAAALGDAIGNAMGTSASARLKQIVMEAGKAGFKLTDAEKLALDPNYKPKKYVKPAAILPTNADMNMPSFISSYNAGIPGAGLEGAYKLMESENIVNPFNSSTDAKAYANFAKTQTQANQYNISINVAPGASGAQIGQAMVNAIQEYERVKGKVFSK
jgi:hypothetical protein